MVWQNKTKWPKLKAQTTVGSRITVAGRLEIYDGSTLRISKSVSPLLNYTLKEFDYFDFIQKADKIKFDNAIS